MRALTRLPSSTMNEMNCELTYIDPEGIDTALAIEQHAHYRAALEDLGFHVDCLPANEEFPDSVFVEDPVVVLDEVAILTHPGTPSRVGEVPYIEHAISEFRPIQRITPPATLEGGDVLRVGRTLYVGLSARTNDDGISQFRGIVEPLGYQVVPVTVHGALHLKTAVTALDDTTLLVNRDWIDLAPFTEFELIDVPSGEPFAANIIPVGKRVLMHIGFAGTRRRVESRGFEVVPVDISEFLKAEAGLTCMSVRMRLS